MRACDCGQPGMPQEVFEYAIEQSHAVYVKYPDGLQRERESAMIKAFIFGTVAWRFQRLTRQLMGIGTAMGITTATQFLFLSTRQARTTAFQPPHIR